MGAIIIDTILAIICGYVNYKIGWYPGILCVAESFFLAFACWVYFRIMDRNSKDNDLLIHLSIAFVMLISNLFWSIVIFYLSKLIGG